MSGDARLAALKTYFDLMAMNGGARIYRAAVEIGIFTALAAAPATAGAIAAACGLQERGVALLLEGLCGLGAVRRENDLFALTPVMQLLQGQYRNLGDEYWDHLPRFLRTGAPIARMDAPQESEAQYQKQVAALAWMMRPSAEALAQVLGMGRDRRGLSILDVGAGSAVWSLTLAAKDPASTVTAMDWPGVLAVAAAAAKDAGMEGRFRVLAGNYHDVALPDAAYDLAIVANVTHIETPEGNRSLFQRLHRALKPGGELAIVDVMPGQEAGDLSRSLYALGLALRTEQGRVYSPGALSELVTGASFDAPVVHLLPVIPFTMGLLLARKKP